MAIPTLSCLPEAFESGDTVNFRQSFGDYPAGTWAAKLYLSLNGTAAANFTATADGTSHLFSLTAAGTGTLSPGSYDWAIYVTSGSDRARAATGRVEVLADLTEMQSASADQAALTAAYATRTALLAKKNATIDFNGQQTVIQDIAKLEKVISRLEAKVKAERDRQQGLRGNPVSRVLRPYF